MSEKERDTTWKGKKYLEHVGEFKQVIRASSREEIERFRRLIERFSERPESIPGECHATVRSDAGETVEFRGDNFEALWETLSVHLLAPEAKWLEFTISLPSIALSGHSSWRFENPNVSTQTFDTDGSKIVRTVSVPLKQGTPPPVFEKTTLLDLLKHWKNSASVPLPFEFGDNYYSEEELKSKGIRDYNAFAKHFEETQDEERWEARIFDENDNEIWSSISNDREALTKEMLKQGEPKGKERWQLSPIRRNIHPQRHPLEDFRIRILSEAARALEIVETAGPDSPISAALELGIRLATLVEGMKARATAPERLRDPWRKRRGKGKEKHEKKTAKMRHLRAEVSRILLEYHKAGNPLKPSEILRKLKPSCTVDGDTIQHPMDAEGYTISHLKKTVIPELRKALSKE